MFRTGVYYTGYAQMQDPAYLNEHMDAGLAINYTVSGRRIDQVTVYSSDLSYFAGAAAIELFTISIILYTFYGFWRLGRNTSLSPLETAKAFDAPLLADAPTNLNGGRIAKIEQHQKVKYGFFHDRSELDAKVGCASERLIIAEQSSVQHPSGTRLGLREFLQLMKMKLPAVKHSATDA